jgi:endonuclease/exonuclease/phosphatase family metal-dependent hydrolase
MLRLATYNIRNGRSDDGLDGWSHRKGRAIALMRELAFDLAGLQEVYDFQLDDILAAMPKLQAIGVGRDDGQRKGEMAAIVFDSSRLGLVDSGHFWFSSTPDVPGSRDWGNVNVRMCTWGKFRDLSSEREFALYNVHLDHVSSASRERSVEVLVRRIEGGVSGLPVVVTGDFNVGEENPVIVSMREAGFRDSFRVVHQDVVDVGTFNGFAETCEPDKIDYIWVDGAWDVVDAEIVRTKIDGRWPSDHAAVTATLVFPSTSGRNR